MPDAGHLWAQAIKCRDLASAADDKGVRQRLLHMAHDYEARAAKLDGSGGESESAEAELTRTRLIRLYARLFS